MKTISIPDQILLWIVGIGVPAVIMPTVSSTSKSIFDRFPLCALALYTVTLLGLLLSLKVHDGKMSEREICRRKMVLQTIPIWGLAATAGLIYVIGNLLLNLPRSIWKFLEPK